MVKKLLIAAIGFSISTSAFGAKVTITGGLQDGFVLRGVDGKVNGPDANDVWGFKLSADVNDEGKGVVKAGTTLELLPSATLEKITADINERAAAAYRLWGRVTRYKGKNFIFPVYFLPLSKMETPSSQMLRTQEPSPQKSTPAEAPSAKERKPERDINEPNDILSIPQEIVEKLRTRRIAQPVIRGPGEVNPPYVRRINVVEQKPGAAESRDVEAGPEKRPEFKKDAILADRTAVLVKQDDGRFVFVLDALGLNTPEVSLRSLPCEALELTEQRQSALSEPAPFKIAGIMTKYKGKHYLLLQKATRAYNYGNFGG